MYNYVKIINSFWLYFGDLLVIAALSTAGCVGSAPPTFSYGAQQRGNALCATMYDNHNIQLLSGKMPLRPGEMPTREMLMINESPDKNEVQAIGALEAAVRNCHTLRANAGQPTSASEDILEARTSQLRYGLYKGAIPYGAYNYGLAQVLKRHADFLGQTKPSPNVTGSVPLYRQFDAATFGTWTCPSQGACY